MSQEIDSPLTTKTHIKAWGIPTLLLAVPTLLLFATPHFLAVLALAGGVGGVIAATKSPEFRGYVEKALDSLTADFRVIGADLKTLGKKLDEKPVIRTLVNLIRKPAAFISRHTFPVEEWMINDMPEKENANSSSLDDAEAKAAFTQAAQPLAPVTVTGPRSAAKPEVRQQRTASL